jgi:hypothetical protein
MDQYSLTQLQAVPLGIAEVVIGRGGLPVTVKSAVGEEWAKQAGRMEMSLLSGDDLRVVHDRPAGGDSRTPRTGPPAGGFACMDAAIAASPSSARTQLTVSTSALLVPPLVQPRSAEFPLGVLTVTFTVPGPEISPVVSFTVNFLSLITFALRVFPLMTTSDAATKLLPFTVTRTPCCT